MLHKYTTYWLYLLIVCAIFSCSNDNGYEAVEPDPVSPVVFNFNEVPYETLSEYNFFDGDLKALDPVYGVIPYDLNSTLFTDYAKKKRFIWMPDNVQATYVNDYSVLDFPDGTVLIKNFYYDNVLPDNATKIIETRLMFKLENSWRFANYLWNEDQTEAYFTTEASAVVFDWIEEGETKSVNYRIPRFAECFSCHNNNETPIPIGPKPQNLNKSFPYAEGQMNQLSKLIDQGYLNGDIPSNIVSTVNWKDVSQSLSERVRSYFDINCAHCHSEGGYCDYGQIGLAYSDYEDDTSIGVCVENLFFVGDEFSHIIKPGDLNASALYFRLLSVEDEFKMPLIGRTLVHEEGVALIEQWINSLNINCY